MCIYTCGTERPWDIDISFDTSMWIYICVFEVCTVCQCTYVYWRCAGCVNIHMWHRDTL